MGENIKNRFQHEKTPKMIQFVIVCLQAYMIVYGENNKQI